MFVNSLIIDFFMPATLVGAVIAVLVILITIVDRIVNNYGEVTVNINKHSKDLTIKGGAPLLQSLAEQKIYIPSACGGKGTCGACKTKVLSDVGPLLPTESPFMTESEKANHIRLACQVKVKKDIDIDIPEELFNVQDFHAETLRTKFVTYDIIELYLKLDKPFKFKAGMYMQIVIPPYKARNRGELSFKGSTMRAYSISSPPSDTEHAEFLVRYVPNGIATTYIHQHLQEGMPLQVIGPFGDFYRRETDAIMVCIAGGSGMAPFRSIFREMEEKELFDKEVWYFFGCRNYPDIYYLKEMRALERKWPNFHFICALSDQELTPPDSWDEEKLGSMSLLQKGRIDKVLQRYLQEHISKEKDREGYLCGSPLMINSCSGILVGEGIDEDRIYYDSF